LTGKIVQYLVLSDGIDSFHEWNLIPLGGTAREFLKGNSKLMIRIRSAAFARKLRQAREPSAGIDA